jgi:malonyl-CoA/methylmalonyl-CoA synthetase
VTAPDIKRPGLYEDLVGAWPAGRVLVEWDGQELLSHELLDEVQGIAAALAGRGISAGDVVGLQLPRSPRWLTTALAVWRLGAVLLPMNDQYTSEEVEAILADAGARLYLGPHRPSVANHHELAPEPGSPPTAAVADQDVAAMLYTSGTTGKPKGARITRLNLRSQVEALRSAWAITDQDVLLHTLPLFHVHGLVVAALAVLSAGGRLILAGRFDAKAVRDRLLGGDVTVFMGVPTFYHRLLELPELGPFPGVRLFTSGSAPLPAADFDRWNDRTGSPILERYGLTEGGIVLSNPLDGPRLAGTVGYPLPGVVARIDQRDEAGHGEGVGELWIQGPTVFAGYHRRPEATAAALADGWLHTGDLGRMDADGRVTIVGRRTDLVLTGGLNVYPAEVEAVLAAHPAVREVAVTGVSDPDWGERVVAALVTAEDIDLTTLRDWLRFRLAAYKVPKHLEVVASLPRNAMGKLDRIRLRRQLEAVVVRPARPDDAPRMAQGNVAMARETEGLALDPLVALAGSEAVFRDTSRGRYFVAERAGLPVGQCLVTFEWSDWRNRPVWWLQSVYVEPPWRGQGGLPGPPRPGHRRGPGQRSRRGQALRGSPQREGPEGLQRLRDGRRPLSRLRSDVR